MYCLFPAKAQGLKSHRQISLSHPLPSWCLLNALLLSVLLKLNVIIYNHAWENIRVDNVHLRLPWDS